jgi:two-component system sensor histidine kinase KdpD
MRAPVDRPPDASLYRRPDPDALLRHMERLRRGRLKIFLGLAPGVGKTYAMLQEAHALVEQGVDVVVGVVDTHGRPETARLLEGLEVVPLRQVEYRGLILTDLDAEAVVARRPELALVDELAHTNPPGSPRRKRYEDVEYLRDHGIHVYTTLNVQHLESLNDHVFQLTGVRVTETVQDQVLDEATEIRLVDLSPEELLQRLDEGKVYPPETAERAKTGFFRQENLTALRELALRVLADHVDRRLSAYLAEHLVEGVLHPRDKVMVAIPPAEIARRLVRRGYRLAIRLRAELHVVYVEQPRRILTPLERQHLERALALAAELHAQVHQLRGNVYREILRFVQENNITHAVLGVSQRHQGILRLRPSLLEALQRSAPNMEILLVGQRG